ncbi:MAG: hypothetical protein HZA61_03570 [Candidatus Eisenbacteria bacterium]|uniref:Uncharacterized protein n=1 Tax=Eiseniibacteriota bacterium TaxID=2212470 RepID=A0A933SAH8_UNCEI|nr:hypothetical protein [Candidatus Eisenbacteria bacterium]
MMRRAALVLGMCLSVSPVFAAVDADHFAPGAHPVISQSAQDAVNYDLRVMGQNRLGISITNYGFIGNNFTTRSASMEYPFGSGYEHLVRGGLWVGALAVDDNGGFTGVTTSAVDGSQGSASADATEFTPVTPKVSVRSTLPNSRYYHPDAVSELDYSATFWDGVAKRALGNNEDHRPMKIQVKQENYAWSFSDYGNFVIFHYTIYNVGPPLRNVWVGMYDELQSGNKSAYNCWPPSSGCSSIGGWFGKKQVGYTDSLRLFNEFYCQNTLSCRNELAPPMAGVLMLGVRPGTLADTVAERKQVSLSVWSYAPGNAARDEDVEKYQLMSTGAISPLSPLPDSLKPENGGDPVFLLSAGPFAEFAAGDSIQVDFAYVGSTGANTAEKLAALRRYARFAQRAYDRNYKVPVPPPSPRMKVVPRDAAFDIYWDESPEFFADRTSPDTLDFEGYRVYVGEGRDTLGLVAQFDKATAPGDTLGYNTGFTAVRLATPVVYDGVTYHYKYTVDHLRNGFRYYVAVTAYDLGNSEIESLESGFAQNELMATPAPAPSQTNGAAITVFPNPYRVDAMWDKGESVRDHYLWFANLPSKATIRIYTLSGDLVYEYDFDGATYDGRNARGINDPRTDLRSTLSGASFGWDMITRNGQAAATGLYMWAVEDKQSGKRSVGKFLIVKSDREGVQ